MHLRPCVQLNLEKKLYPESLSVIRDDWLVFHILLVYLLVWMVDVSPSSFNLLNGVTVLPIFP